MKRREFCRTTLAAGMAAAYPFMTGCGRETPAPVTATEAETSIAAISLDGTAIELERAAIRELGEASTGEILLAGDAGFDSARKIWNGMHDRRPALIARCVDHADVQRAVTFARERNLLVAVRGGGHSWPGLSVADGGLMIDLALQNTVTVDPARQRASAQGGALLNHLDSAALPHGLVTTAGVVSHTGVGGFTLGGGFGRLNRKFGLAVDNLVAADIVTADGQFRTVSAEQEPDLLWALRGGGGNFGVVTRFEYQLHPFDRNVLSGMIVWPVAQAREVLDFYAGWYTGLSDDLYVGPVMLTMPDGTSVVAMEVVYAGDPALGEKELEPLRRIGKPIDDGVKVQDYMVMQTQEDGTFAHGIRSYIKNGMVREITPALIEAMIGAFVPDPRLAMFTHTSGGAVNRVDDLATAFPHRNAETMVLVGGGWTDPVQDEEAIALARSWYAQLEPFTGGFYDNIDFDAADPAGANFGPAFERLARIKAQYDPGNLFRLNRNIRPAA
ncbi:MAG: FAD-binding oxidoreductase [Lysobacterales bacterium]|nr:MAG: FAD-binding oxidoreductase [Xanthomonadales bacterium]